MFHFVFVTDKNGVCYSLNKNEISRIVDTREGIMIVMTDGVVIYSKEKFLDFAGRLNAK